MLGMYDVESIFTIIVPARAGSLAVGAIDEVPVLHGDLYTERQMMLTLSADHRATDGAEGARFTGEIVSCLQNPDRVFV